MSDIKKPAHVLELEVAADATPEAVWKAISEAAGVQNWFAPEVTSAGTGVGSTLTVSWGGDMAFTTAISAWEPNKHVQWLHEDMMGPGTKLVADWFITTEAGKTRLRLVQSGFGEFDGWDDFLASTETGWKYFLYNLRVYVEKHAGKTRRLISSRFPVGISRAAAWKKFFTPGTGLVMAASTPPRQGEHVKIDLGEAKPLEAVVEIAIAERALAVMIPALGDALLFVEFEGGGESFSIGAWLSLYDAAVASRVEAPAKRAMDRLAAAVK